MSEPQPTADYVLPHYNDLGAFHQAGGYVNFIHELVTENPSVDVDALKEGSQDAFLAMLGSLSIPPHIPAQDASSLRSDLIKLALDDVSVYSQILRPASPRNFQLLPHCIHSHITL